MSKEVTWTKKVLDNFIELAMLTDDEVYIMRSRVKGITVTQQALALNKSESSVHRMIKELKKKYDAVQAEHPDKFPPRRFSEKETYMDTH